MATNNPLLRPAIHGYALMKQLAEIGVEVPPTTGGLYRTLRTLADEGLIESVWDTPQRGPARRIYLITPLGQETLDEEFVPSLASHLKTARDLLNRRRNQTPRPVWRPDPLAARLHDLK